MSISVGVGSDYRERRASYISNSKTIKSVNVSVSFAEIIPRSSQSVSVSVSCFGRAAAIPKCKCNRKLELPS